MQLMSALPTIDRQPDYWMDRTDYTRPDFNYTNPRSHESLKLQSTGSMLNNNNPNTINSNNNNNNNQSSIINAADAWCSDFVDYQPLLFSPDSSKSSNSPSGLNSSDLTEESFIFETNTDEPVKYSQDYENFEFVDEINQISKLNEFNTDDEYQSKYDLKTEYDDSNAKYESTVSLEAKTVLYQDTMITGLAPPTMLMDEDSYLVTVNNFDDLFIKPVKQIDGNVSNINMESGNSQVASEQNLSNFILTPAPSPKSPSPSINENIDDIDCESPVNEMNIASSPAEDRLNINIEHNYNINNSYNNRIGSSCKRKLVTEKRTRRALKLKLPTTTMRALPLLQDSSKIDVNTPDITNDILEMEDEKFDLITYITSISSQENTDPTIEFIEVKPPTPLDLEAIINEQCPIPTKRRRINSYDNPGSVQSTTSNDSSTVRTPKRRGRPPKTDCTLPSPSQYKHLSESDWKYVEMRNKNNEASRRSRINRKDREHQIESEARELESEYMILAEEEKTLLKQVAKWRGAVMKLAQI